MSKTDQGTVVSIDGPVIGIKGLKYQKIGDLVKIGTNNLIGEIIKIVDKRSIATCYEYTEGLRIGEPVINTKEPLSMELGPGLLNNIYDGIQRTLPTLREKYGDFIEIDQEAAALDPKKQWLFEPRAKEGTRVSAGDIIGVVQESNTIEHRIMVPIGVQGKLTSIARPSKFTVLDDVYTIKNGKKEQKFGLSQKWSIRSIRPYFQRIFPTKPLITGMRVIDILFPVAKGGVVACPGGFGTGKCVLADTPVLLANGEIRSIKDIYDYFESTEKLTKNSDESLVELPDKFEVLAFNQTVLKKKRATHIYRGKSNTILQIKTRTGRTVGLTPAHKLHVFDGQNIVEKPARDVNVGDYIAVPRKIKIEGKEILFDIEQMDDSLRIVDKNALNSIKDILEDLLKTYQLKEIASFLNVSYGVLFGYWQGKNKPTLNFLQKLIHFSESSNLDVKEIKAERQSKPFKFPTKLTKEMAEWLGLFVADGHIKGKYGGVYLYNTSVQILNRFQDLTKKVFDLDAEFGQDSEDRTPFMCIRNTSFTKFLYMLGIPKENKTYEIETPKCILQSPDSFLIHFLNGYYAGDGWFSKYTVGFSTASKNLHIGLSYIFVRLGILYRASKKKNSYFLELEGKRSEELALLFKNSDIFIYDKILPLFDYLEKNVKHFDGLDIVPVDNKILDVFKAQGKDNRGHNIFRKYGKIRLDNYLKRNQTPTLSMLQKICALIDEYTPDIDQETLNTFRKILKISEYIYFDEIKDVEKIKKETDVYDITVEDYHNFVGGKQPILLHNTVIQHNLAKWADANIIVYVGCGERGNEMADVLEQFPNLIDPHTDRPLMERTVLIGNTSNMPVSAREASIFSGLTIAEYYRDMGYDVALLADSTTRWAEALRELSGRLEEMPAEGGYPAYLSTRLASFYERAGLVKPLGSPNRIGSITLVGAVSPPSGDFSEPVTKTTRRFVKAFWALDAKLAYSRHYPSISWTDSYSLYSEHLEEWWNKLGSGWARGRTEISEILALSDELHNIVQLVGKENLPAEQQLTLFVADLVKNVYLIQNAFDPVDRYSSPEKSLRLVNLILDFFDRSKDIVNRGIPLFEVENLPIVTKISRARLSIKNEDVKQFDILNTELEIQCTGLVERYESA